MKKTALNVLFLGTVFLSSAQTKVDSLLKSFQNSKSDTTKIFTLLWISDYYYDVSNDSSLQYAQKAYQLAKKINFIKGQSQSLNIIANLYSDVGKYAQAFDTHIEVLKINEKANDQRGMAASYNNLALIHQDQGDFKGALDKFITAKNIYEKIQYDTSNTLKNDMLKLLLNIGNNYYKLEILDSALMFQHKAYDLATNLKDKENIGQILINIGNIHFDQNHHIIALSHFQQAITYALADSNLRFLSEAYFGIARYFDLNNQIDSSIIYAKKALSNAIAVPAYFQMNKAASLLTNHYLKLKNIDSAFLYQTLSIKARDNLFNSDTVRAVQTKNIREQLRQEERALAEVREKEERKVNLQYLAISIFIISFFGLLYYLSRWKYKPRIVKHIGLVGLLMTFEFISIFLHPYVGSITHHEPIFMLLIFVTIASLLVPVHHKLEHWVEEKLTPKKKRGPKKGSKKPVNKKVEKEQAEIITDPDLSTATEV